MGKHGWWVSVGVGLCLLSGCGGGGKPATLKGNVTYSGEAVASGSMRLDPSDESENRSAGARIVNGAYSFDEDSELQAGSYHVSIQAFNDKGPYIPAKYNDRTELTVEVQPGENTRDFDLKP